MKPSINEVLVSASVNTLDSANPKKPVFLTKSQREELTLKLRHEEISEQRRRREQLVRSITEAENANLDRKRDRRDHDFDRRERDREPERRIRDPEEREREKELDAIKEQYLGSNKPKKRMIIKPSEKFRFSFDWENTEDSSRDTNTLYQNPHEAQLLFGRGFRAGIDRREQKKQSENHDRHWSEKRLEEMTERDWRIFKEDFNISYKGTKIPHPMRTWEESNLSSELLKAVESSRYEKPTPIQMATIPLGLQQRDVIGTAATGSGKTIAFVLPMLAYISRLPPISEENKTEGPYALVMAPSRELALQIKEVTVKYARYLGFKVISMIGGQSIEEQRLKMITQGCEIVIATPGRLIDCLERRYVVLNQCNYVVLDEADRMIDLGFEPQVASVLDAMPSSNLKPEYEEEKLDEKRIYRTTYMFSATMPPGVERLARKYLRNPVVVTIGKTNTDLISQHVIMTKESEKFYRLKKLLDELGDEKTAIVFVNTKRTADSIAKNLDKAGYRVMTLHGGKSQEQREFSLEGFKAKRYNVLVATNVVGRGIDVSDLAHVINYDMPKDIETYTHRIGRTGRAGKSGVATSFVTLDDTEVFYDLKQKLVESNSPVPPELARHEASRFKPGTVRDRIRRQ